MNGIGFDTRLQRPNSSLSIPSIGNVGRYTANWSRLEAGIEGPYKTVARFTRLAPLAHSLDLNTAPGIWHIGCDPVLHLEHRHRQPLTQQQLESRHTLVYHFGVGGHVAQERIEGI